MYQCCITEPIECLSYKNHTYHNIFRVMYMHLQNIRLYPYFRHHTYPLFNFQEKILIGYFLKEVMF